MSSYDEMTDIQNACVEVGQEEGIFTVPMVVDHVRRSVDNDDTATIARYVTEGQVKRAIATLRSWGIVRSLPRASRGWGQGWHIGAYQLLEREKKEQS